MSKPTEKTRPRTLRNYLILGITFFSACLAISGTTIWEEMIANAEHPQASGLETRQGQRQEDMATAVVADRNEAIEEFVAHLKTIDNLEMLIDINATEAGSGEKWVRVYVHPEWNKIAHQDRYDATHNVRRIWNTYFPDGYLEIYSGSTQVAKSGLLGTWAQE